MIETNELPVPIEDERDRHNAVDRVRAVMGQGPEVRYLFLFAGDDRTVIYYGESYVARLREALFTGWDGLAGEVVGVGHSGDTVVSLQARLGDALRRHRPHWVVLSVGANDVLLPWLSARGPIWWVRGLIRRIRQGQVPVRDLDRFASSYRALIDEARAVAGARVVVCTVGPLGERLSTSLNRQVARLNGVIRHVAIDRGVPVADVWQASVEVLSLAPRQSRHLPRWQWSQALDRRRLRRPMADRLSRRRRLQLTVDGIHLNARGANIWALAVLRTLSWYAEVLESEDKVVAQE